MVVGLNIFNRWQSCVNALELWRDGDVTTWMFQTRYSNNAFFVDDLTLVNNKHHDRVSHTFSFGIFSHHQSFAYCRVYIISYFLIHYIYNHIDKCNSKYYKFFYSSKKQFHKMCLVFQYNFWNRVLSKTYTRISMCIFMYYV